MPPTPFDYSMPLHPPDATCLIRAIAGDQTALTRLLYANYGWLERHIDGLVPHEMSARISAEDVLQDTFSVVYLDIRGLRSSSPQAFCKWLKTIAENRLKNEIRAHRTKKRGGDKHQIAQDAPDDSSFAAFYDTDFTPRASMERVEAIHAVKHNVNDLPSDQKTAIQMLLDDNSLEQMAAAMGKSTGAVRGLLHRAKLTLRSALGSSSRWFHTK